MEIVVDLNENFLKLVENFSKILKSGDIILLDGQLGAGKTTFVKKLGEKLGVKKIINSPTFNIVKTYNANDVIINHFDFYRIKESYIDLDIMDYFTQNSITFIEWPFICKLFLPKEYILVKIEYIDDNKRKYIFTFEGNRYKGRWLNV